MSSQGASLPGSVGGGVEGVVTVRDGTLAGRTARHDSLTFARVGSRDACNCSPAWCPCASPFTSKR
jgi:hypothetical protein